MLEKFKNLSRKQKALTLIVGFVVLGAIAGANEDENQAKPAKESSPVAVEVAQEPDADSQKEEQIEIVSPTEEEVEAEETTQEVLSDAVQEEEGAPEQIEEATPSIEEAQPETPEVDPIEVIREKVQDFATAQLGSKTNTDMDRIKEISVFEYFGENPDGMDKNIVWIKFFADENLSEKLTKGGVINDAVGLLNPELFKTSDGVFQLDDSIFSVGIVVYMRLYDVSGSEFESKELQFIIDRDEYDGIGWENFFNENIQHIANQYSEGPYLRGIDLD